NALVEFLAVAVPAAVFDVFDLVFDFVLNRMHTVAHLVSPSVDVKSAEYTLSRSGMGSAVDFEQAVGVNSRIDRGRRQRGVAEQLLDSAQIAAPRQKVRCKRMAKCVRRRRIRQAKRAA